jgi:acyl-coenzyme A synthetase/AMP-(fatty) acid ligase
MTLHALSRLIFLEELGGTYYFAGDSANRDVDGYIWIMGRIDDVLNVSGHRLGTMEIESALVANPKWPKQQWWVVLMPLKAKRWWPLWC